MSHLHRLCSKISALHRALGKIPTAYVLSVDNSDAVINGDIRQIKECTKDAEALFGTEMNHYPQNVDRGFEDAVGNGKYRYLNSGAFLSKKSFLEELFQESPPPKPSSCINDQEYYKLMFKKYHPRITMDYGVRCIQNLNGAESDVIL